MSRSAWLAGAALALTSTLALAAPESLLPPSFSTPAPAPAPAPRQTSAPAPSQTAAPVIQPQPGIPAAELPGDVVLPGDFPSIAELEKMEPDELDELFGLKPRYDVPPGAQRALRRVGVIGTGEGGFPSGSLAGQPASLVQAALAGTRGPLVSRWGHILLRRALTSRLDAPQGMDPVHFTALRAALLNRMGEGAAARALVQDVDSANFDALLTSAAFDAYLATGDIVGICPVARLKGDLIEDPQWELALSICAAFDGESRRSGRELDRALASGIAPRIDVLLAQRYAGAAGEGRRAVNVEWDGVDELTPWRLALARALGVEIPESLRSDTGSALMRNDVFYPAAPLLQRVAAADRAARDGVLSSAAMVDLYSQLWSDPETGESDKADAAQLREAYLAREPGDRLSAIRALWGNGEPDYARQVLTAFAAARLPVDAALADDAAPLIASMLAAGLDRNAMRWGGAVEAGSAAWALLALAQPVRQGSVAQGAVGTFVDADESPDKRKSQFLVAGLAGLGRLDSDAASDLSGQLGFDLGRESKWSRAIDQAAGYGNATLVALLAGLGMQGSGWDKMTARHLFHIVRALDRAGLNAEARMIAAEAVARG